MSELQHDPEAQLAAVLARWRVPLRDVAGLDAAGGGGERVGKGHFGEVVRARLRNEPVVVKVSRTRKLDERRVREARADLENECRLLGAMKRHHNVVEMRGVVAEEHPQPFFGLVLAFYALGSMKSVFKERTLPLRTKVKVLYGIGCGIAYLHQNGIEHRDLWPANVLLDADYTAKLADFGLAITQHTTKIPNKCQFRWSSPQRCNNHIKRTNRYEPKNDVWSFGMICYWALTGHKPFKEIEKGNMVRYELEKGEKPRFSRSLELPLALIEAIDSCWVYNTRERPAMAEVCGRLSRVLVRDAAQLGDDHPDAGEVDRDAWRPLMPGKRESAHQRESSAMIRLKAMDSDLELLEQRRESLREHFRLVREQALEKKKKGKKARQLVAAREEIAARMEAELAALDAEIEHKRGRRAGLAKAARSAKALAEAADLSAAEQDGPGRPSRSSSSTAIRRTRRHRSGSGSGGELHRRHSSVTGGKTRPTGSGGGGGASSKKSGTLVRRRVRKARRSAASDAKRSESKEDTDGDKATAVAVAADESSSDATSAKAKETADADDAASDAASGTSGKKVAAMDEDESSAEASASDDDESSNTDPATPRPIGAKTRAIIGDREQPEAYDNGESLQVGDKLFVLHRSSGRTLQAVNVVTGARGTFPKTAVRGTSRVEEREILELFEHLKVRKRLRTSSHSGIAAQPQPLKAMGGVKSARTSDRDSERSAKKKAKVPVVLGDKMDADGSSSSDNNGEYSSLEEEYDNGESNDEDENDDEDDDDEESSASAKNGKAAQSPVKTFVPPDEESSHSSGDDESYGSALSDS